MPKKVFTGCFLLICIVICAASLYHFASHRINILTADDPEHEMEAAIPANGILKEIYGLSNQVLSPNEITGTNAQTVREEDGFLYRIGNTGRASIEFAEENISELNEFCEANGTEFAFIHFPSKGCEGQTEERYGILSNGLEIREEFHDYMDAEGINYLDVWPLMREDGYTINDVFFRTDHHWTTESGLYAARAIGTYLNAEYGWNLNTDALAEDRMTYRVMEDLWFGETGRNVSLTWVDALDDFTVILPNYETEISRTAPDGTTTTGDFANMFVNESGYDGNVDLYNYSAYYSYGYSIDTMARFRNEQSDQDGKRILLIHDSFSQVMMPFLILETGEITTWDVRDDTSGLTLYEYIEQNDFDIVLLAYTDFWNSKMWGFE